MGFVVILTCSLATLSRKHAHLTLYLALVNLKSINQWSYYISLLNVLHDAIPNPRKQSRNTTCHRWLIKRGRSRSSRRVHLVEGFSIAIAISRAAYHLLSRGMRFSRVRERDTRGNSSSRHSTRSICEGSVSSIVGLMTRKPVLSRVRPMFTRCDEISPL